MGLNPRLRTALLAVVLSIAAANAAAPTTDPTTAPHAGSPPAPPAATTRDVSNTDRRAYLSALWAQHPDYRLAGIDPLYRSRSGTIVPFPALPDRTPRGATLLSIHCAGSAREALIEVARAGDLRFIASRAGLFHRAGIPDASLDLVDRPLLEAVYEICSQSGLQIVKIESPPVAGATRPSSPREPGRMVLGPQPGGHAPGVWCTSGPFLYEVRRIEHSVFLAGIPDDRVHMVFSAWAEPKIRVLAGPGRLVLDEVIDENGNSLIPPGDRNSNPKPGAEFQVDLAYPKTAGRKIARFRATDHCITQRASINLQLPVPQTSTQLNVEGMTLAVEVRPSQGSGYKLALIVGRGERSEFDWNRLRKAMGNLQPQLLNAAGAPLHLLSDNDASGANDATTEYLWETGSRQGIAGKPARLLIEFPTDTWEVEVPIAFDNLPLP